MAAQAARALSLYRKLWRQSRALPGHVKDYYRGSIRSGFVSFRDEDDPDLLDRIFRQSQIDAEWVLNKYKHEQGKPGVRR